MVNIFNKNAFTLLELVIAISIVAIISSLTWGVFSRSFIIRDKISQIDEIYHAQRLAINRISSEVAQAFLKQKNPDISFVGKDNDGLDSVRFNSFSHFRFMAESKESDTNTIEYFIEKTDNGQILKRREKFVVDNEPDKGGESYVLTNNVKEFDLKFCDGVALEWKEDWDSTKLEFSGRLPVSVLISLKIEDPKTNEELSFRALSNIEWKNTEGASQRIIEKGCELDK